MQKATLRSLPGPNFPAITRNTLDGRPIYNDESGLPLIPSKCVRSLVYPAKCSQYTDMPGRFWWELWQIFAIFRWISSWNLSIIGGENLLFRFFRRLQARFFGEKPRFFGKH